jgi:hypothetical protein
MKIHPMRAEVFHEDRQTEEWTYMTKLTSFRNFAKAAAIVEQHILLSADTKFK